LLDPQNVDFLGIEAGCDRGLTAVEATLGDPDGLPELSAKAELPFPDLEATGGDLESEVERAGNSIGRVVGKREIEIFPGSWTGFHGRINLSFKFPLSPNRRRAVFEAR